ncbi:hypothetical protein JB92DRAFT_581132 [Gautieria morchelliformis]|nr:hypothetical protein JB92DRAFT_581132 [Gautieria morchelliformis]
MLCQIHPGRHRFGQIFTTHVEPPDNNCACPQKDDNIVVHVRRDIDKSRLIAISQRGDIGTAAIRL